MPFRLNSLSNSATYRALCAVLAAVIAISGLSLLTASSAAAEAAPSVTSDKGDYAPGEVVTLTGADWQPGESVHLTIDDELGRTWQRQVDVVADGAGSFTDKFALPDWFVASYTVVAEGAVSGTARHAFTDSNMKVALSGIPGTVSMPYQIYTNSACTTPSTANGNSGTVVAGSTSDTVGGIGTNEWFKVTAPTSANGGTFQNWTIPSRTPSTTTETSPCVRGSSGSETITANYSAPTNVAPTATVALTPKPATTNQTLTATATKADANNDPVTLTYVWKVGTTTVQTTAVSSSLTDTLDMSLAGQGNKGQQVSVTVTPNDGKVNGAAVSDSLTVANSGPVAVADSKTTDEDTALVFAANDLAGNDTDADGDLRTVTAVSGPSHGSVGLSGGNITFTPDTNYNGPASFSYTVSDGSASDSGNVAVTVTPVNDTPSATAKTVELAKGSSDNAIQLSGDDVETSAANLTYTVATGPTHGSLSGTGRNLTYTPDAGYKGQDSFTFTVTDQGDGSAAARTSSTATVTINVNAAATATEVDDKTATYGDSSVNLSASVTLDGDPLPVDSGKVTFTLKDGSTVIGTPADDTTIVDGAASVTYALPAGTDADDYTIHAAYDGTTLDNSSGTGTLTLDKAELAVNAQPDEKEYGDPDPTFDWGLTGFENSEDETSAGVAGAADCSREDGLGGGGQPLHDHLSPGYVGCCELLVRDRRLPRTLRPPKAELAVNALGRRNGGTATRPDVRLEPDRVQELGENAYHFRRWAGAADCSRRTDKTVVGSFYTITCAPGTLAAANYSFVTGDTARAPRSPRPCWR